MITCEKHGCETFFCDRYQNWQIFRGLGTCISLGMARIPDRAPWSLFFLLEQCLSSLNSLALYLWHPWSGDYRWKTWVGDLFSWPLWDLANFQGSWARISLGMASIPDKPPCSLVFLIEQCLSSLKSQTLYLWHPWSGDYRWKTRVGDLFSCPLWDLANFQVSWGLCFPWHGKHPW